MQQGGISDIRLSDEQTDGDCDQDPSGFTRYCQYPVDKQTENYEISIMERQTNEGEYGMRLRKIRLLTQCVSPPREAR
jgi:hypothetical protein